MTSANLYFLSYIALYIISSMYEAITSIIQSCNFLNLANLYFLCESLNPFYMLCLLVHSILVSKNLKIVFVLFVILDVK